ncbi:MAG TPA: mannosyl-3-phosphoglycerate phosphatase [Vicinamibacteria bacterium]
MGRVRDLLVITDLDGTLLDEATYEAGPARDALLGLDAAGVGLVLASSKTRAEMEALAASLPGAPPVALVVENGGALLRLLAGREPETTVLGAPHRALVAALAEIAAESGARLQGFSALAPGDLARLTGLGPHDVKYAQKREYDEPFLVLEGDLGRLAAAASRRGLRLHRGGRFFHLTGGSDKGRAVRVLLGLLAAEGRLFHTVGIGDAPNDLAFLEAVDEAILVPRPDGRVHEGLAHALPRARHAPAPGPAGWNAAVLDLLARRGRAPTVSVSGARTS